MNKISFLAVLACSSFLFNSSHAQSGVGRSVGSEPVVATVKSVKQHVGKSNDPKARLDAIESLYGSEIEANTENIQELARIFESDATLSERVAAIRVFADLHKPENAHAANAGIQAKLRALSRSSEREIAVTALLRYSRLEYSPDLEGLLDHNYVKGFISKDDLYGELAHMVLFAPQSDQLRIAEKLKQARNEYALDILASTLKHANVRGRLSKAVRAKFTEVLASNQPGFSVAIGEFSLKEAITYSDWLHAYASLKADGSVSKYNEEILTQIGGKLSNPKRAISFLASPEGKLAASSIGYTRLNEIFSRIEQYSKSLPFPQHTALKDFSASVVQLRNTIRP